MAEFKFPNLAVTCLALACVGVVRPARAEPTTTPTTPAAVPTAGTPRARPIGGSAFAPDDVRRMQSVRYQFRPSRVAVADVADVSMDLDLTADPATRLADAVAAGQWDGVAATLAGLPPQDATAVYRQIVASLNDAGGGAMRPDDVLDLAATLPAAVPMSPDDIAATGQLFGRSLTLAGPTAAAIDLMHKGAGRFGDGPPAKRADTALMLISAGDVERAGRYLPAADVVLAADDPAQDALYQRYAVTAAKAAADHADDTRAGRLLDVAFKLSLRALLRPGGATPTRVGTVFGLARQTNQTRPLLEALRPIVKANGPGLGAVLASAAAVPVQGNAADTVVPRGDTLRMQSQLAAMILADLPADTPGNDPRVEALRVFAANWTKEAALSVDRWKSSSRQPQSIAPVGGRSRAGPGPRPAGPGETQAAPAKELTGEQLWTAAPQGAWRDRIDGPARVTLDRGLIDVAMFLDDSDAALSILPAIAKAYPESDDIVTEALTLWAKQHQTARVDPMLPASTYQAVGIPLTAAQQQRNIDGLAKLLDGIKAVYGRPFPSERLPVLFDAIYSQAEVYGEADLQRVFGPPDRLDTPVLASLCRLMFGNLQGAWLFESVQVASGTGRTENETYKMVLDGYKTLETLLERRAQRAGDPALYALLSNIRFAHADVTVALNQGYGVSNPLRAAAFDAMHRAAALSAAGHDAATSSQSYVTWFARAQGAAKVTGVTGSSLPSDDEMNRLKAAIDALPPNDAATARQALITAVRSQLETVKPDARYRLIQAALRVAGDDPNARGLRTLTRYYGDLLAEVGFVARLDGGPQVGTAPFGLVLSLRHTDRLERQVRGFNKYVQNQFQNQSAASGRPNTVGNYRDDLEKHVRTSLSDAYDVQSFVWSPPDVASLDADRPGWRETPLCYVVLKAKDAVADRVPAMQIDLDFVDQLNVVVLPIPCNALVVDAAKSEPRPVADLAVEQTLNDHDAKAGELELTVMASGHGLVPPLDRVLDLTKLPGLRVKEVEDGGPLADDFDSAGKPEVSSHRKWTVRLAAAAGGTLPSTFGFPALAAAASNARVKYSRFSDADIVDAGPQVTLNGFDVRKPTVAWPWVVLGLVVAGMATAIRALRWRRAAPQAAAETANRPASLHPFDVLARLQKLDRSPDLTADQRARLTGDIGALEQHYFRTSPTAATEPDLTGIADRWR